MRKLKIIPFLLLMTVSRLSAIEVSISHAAFKGDTENYIEFYFYVVGSSIEQVQIDSFLSQGSLEIALLFKQNDSIKKFDKFLLKSPLTSNAVNFYEMRRYTLDNGIYDVDVHVKDAKNDDNALTFKSKVILDFTNTALHQSDISMLKSYLLDSSQNKFVKNGYLLEILPFQYYDRKQTTLIFYSEIYNADKSIGDDFLMSYAVEKADNKNIEKVILIGHKRKKPAPFIANLISMDITNLESGNYILKVTIRNRNNDMLSEKKTAFQRSNPLLKMPLDTVSSDALEKEFVSQLTPQELRIGLKAIAMNIPESETSLFTTIMSNKDSLAQRRFLWRYWVKQNPVMPEQSYIDYMRVAKMVDNSYNNGFGYGFETDRGRIFMKYGRPNDIIPVENETNAPPYEVWVYNKIEKTQQTNVKFLFYNPNLMANGHRLLHSTCRGELQNPRWKRELYKNVPDDLLGNNVDGLGVKSNFNRRAEQIFNDN